MSFSKYTSYTALSKKHRGGRSGQSVQYFTVHHCASTSNGNVEYLAYGNNDVSANYVLRNDNQLVGLIDETIAAWTTGPYVDNQSVTVETVNSSGAPGWNVTAAQKETLAKVFLELCEKYGWGRPSRARIKGHREWPGMTTACPGPDLLGSLNDIANRAAQLWDEARNTPKPPTTPSGTTHTVSKGETLSGIGQKWGVKWQDIANANGIKSPYVIRPGQKLTIPGKSAPTPTPPPAPTKSVDQVAREVIAGNWGNGADRAARLRAAGFNPDTIQNRVNEILGGGSAPARKSNDDIAREIWAGKGNWGSGATRSQRLRAAGYDPDAVQASINRLFY